MGPFPSWFSAARKMLCGETSTKEGMLEEALKDSEFQLILNANPSSRLRVEAGPKGIDKVDENGTNRMGRSNGTVS